MKYALMTAKIFLVFFMTSICALALPVVSRAANNGPAFSKVIFEFTSFDAFKAS